MIIFRWAVGNETRKDITIGEKETEKGENEVGQGTEIGAARGTDEEDVHVIARDRESGRIEGMRTEDEMIVDLSAT